jgi:hypothetical protein
MTFYMQSGNAEFSIQSQVVGGPKLKKFKKIGPDSKPIISGLLKPYSLHSLLGPGGGGE